MGVVDRVEELRADHAARLVEGFQRRLHASAAVQRLTQQQGRQRRLVLPAPGARLARRGDAGFVLAEPVVGVGDAAAQPVADLVVVHAGVGQGDGLRPVLGGLAVIAAGLMADGLVGEVEDLRLDVVEGIHFHMHIGSFPAAVIGGLRMG